jgi:hypothetical protein
MCHTMLFLAIISFIIMGEAMMMDLGLKSVLD